MIEIYSLLFFNQALELKKLQSPLYEFYNTLNGVPPSPVATANGENILNLPPKSRSPKRLPSRRLSTFADAANIASPKSHLSRNAALHDRTLQEIQPPPVGDLNSQQETISPRFVITSFMTALVPKMSVPFYNLRTSLQHELFRNTKEMGRRALSRA